MLPRWGSMLSGHLAEQVRPESFELGPDAAGIQESRICSGPEQVFIGSYGLLRVCFATGVYSGDVLINRGSHCRDFGDPCVQASGLGLLDQPADCTLELEHSERLVEIGRCARLHRRLVIPGIGSG